MTKKQGIFIAFEGLDGSGTTTQIDLLAKKLQKKNFSVIATKEPTNNVVGGLLRGLLTETWATTPEGFQLLFAADRAHHLHREILPAISNNKIVLTDRYLFSTLAYGSIDMPLDWLAGLNARFPIPDLTILLKVAPKECIKRIGQSTRSSFEYFEKEEKLKRVWQTYELLSSDKKNKMVIVDGERSVEEVSEDIFMIVSKKLSA